MAIDPNTAASSKRLGAILLESGLISRGQLAEALQKKSVEGGMLGKILVEMGFVRQDDLVNVLVKQCKIPHISLLDYDIGSDLIKLVPKEICLKYSLIPIDKMGSILTVAMVDPLDTGALEEVKAACPNLRIKPILCTWSHYDQVVRKIFREQPAHTEENKTHEASLADFGLSAKSAKKPGPVAAPPAPTCSESTLEVNQPPAERLGDTEIILEPLPDVLVSPRAPEHDFTTQDGIANAVRAIVSGKVREAVDEILRQYRASIAANGGEVAVGGLDLVTMIRSGVAGAIADAAGALEDYGPEIIAGLKRGTAADLSAEELSALVKVALRQALRDSTADLFSKVDRALS